MTDRGQGGVVTGGATAIDWLANPSVMAGFHIADDAGGWVYRSYREVAELAGLLATRLLHDGVTPDSTVCVILPTDHLCISALYGVWWCGATLTLIAPPGIGDAAGQIAHIAGILGTARPQTVLTSPELAPAVAQAVAAAGLGRPPVVITEALVAAEEPAVMSLRRNDCALLQFTSGSTSSPRGVAVSWANLQANLDFIGSSLGWEPGDGAASWLPLYHDMGLVGATLHTVARQGTCHLMRPDQFIREPRRWLEAMAQAQHSALPSFGLGYLAARVQPEDIAHLDFSGWRSLVIGAEPVDVAHLHSFCELLIPRGFHPSSLIPAYGLAEATLMVTAAAQRTALPVVQVDPGSLQLGSSIQIIRRTTFSGQALPGDSWLSGLGSTEGTVAIRDEDGNTVPDGVLGQVVVSSPSVADGYRGDGPQPGHDGTRFVGAELHTGDAGFCLDDQLYVLGRMGTSLKVRGKAVFMEDVETRIAAATGLPRSRICAVSTTNTAAPGIALFVEEPVGSWAESARRVLRSDLGPAHTQQIVTGPRGLIRRTSSGKPRRSHMWQALVAGDLSGATMLEDTNAPVLTVDPRAHRPLALSPGQLDDLLAKTLQAADVDPRATILLEGSLAEGFGNAASDIDFLAVVPGDADTPTMPTVLFIDGRRTELRTRSVTQLRAQLMVAAAALAEPHGPVPGNDVLNRCQRFLRAFVVRPADDTEGCVRELQSGPLTHDNFAALMQRWWADRARQSLRQAVAAVGLGAQSDARAWVRDGLQQAAKSWAARRGETYLETKWLALQLNRIDDRAVSARYADLDAALAEGAADRNPADVAAALTLAAELGVGGVGADPGAVQFTRMPDVTTWRVGDTVHVVRDRTDVFVLSPQAGQAWRSVVFGRPITEAKGTDGLLAEFVRLGLVGLRWNCGSGTDDIRPAIAMCDPARPYTPPPALTYPPLTIRGACTDGDVALSVLPATRLAECAMSLIWSNIVVENAREDLLGAIKNGQPGVAEVAAARMIGAGVRVLLCAFGVAPLPADVAAAATVDRLLPRTVTVREELLARLSDAQRVSFSAGADPLADAAEGVAALDELIRVIRVAAGSPFPASFNSREEWRRTLDLGYDWLRLGSYLKADIPLDEARDLLTSGGAQPHARS